MKNTMKKILVTALCLLMLCLSLVTASADEAAMVNGFSAPVGSTVTYTLNISDASQKIAGAHLEFYYDRDYLTLQSVTADNMANSTINNDVNQTGRILVINSLVNGTSGLACTEKTALVTLTFEVAAKGDTNITYYVPYLYDIDMVNLYEYTFTTDLTIDGVVATADEAPILEDVSKRDDVTDKGDFANNPQGTGSGEPQAVISTNAAGEILDSNGNVVQGQPVTDAQGNIIGVTPGTDKSLSSGTIVAIVCGGVVVVAIGALIAMKVINDKKADSDEAEDKKKSAEKKESSEKKASDKKEEE
ncbi:MAG: hypothetical protein IJV88_07360 [Ruminococcus sp.]|nr:hypothetical protein [Ruminococcus sp.]